MHRRGREHQRGDHRIEDAAEKPRRDGVGECDVHQREQDGGQPNGPLGERQHGEPGRLQVDEERLPPAIAVVAVRERVLDVDEQRQERTAVIASGGGNRVRLDRRMGFIAAEVDRRARQREQIDRRGREDDGHTGQPGFEVGRDAHVDAYVAHPAPGSRRRSSESRPRPSLPSTASARARPHDR